MSLKDELILHAKEFSKYVAVKKILQKVFCRYERPDYTITPGLINISRTNLKREEFFFYSNNNKLNAYYYNNNSNKLIVVCHGLKSLADDYLPFINYFYNNGFDIISFNSTGTAESEGEYTYGMSQLLIDLDNLIKYIENNEIYSKKELYLFGHSWGGYSVCGVLNLHKNIKKVVSISGFNDAASIIVSTGIYYGGELAGIPKKYIDMYQEEYFKDYLSYSAIKGINESNSHIFLAHGQSDMVVNFNSQSIISRVNDITNYNVKYYIGKNENSGHTNILYSFDALAYQKEVNNKIKLLKLNKEEQIKYVLAIDNYKYSEVNKELFNKIIDFYNR